MTPEKIYKTVLLISISLSFPPLLPEVSPYFLFPVSAGPLRSFPEQGKSQYSWDELEELITDRLEDEKISEQEIETLMRRLMDIDCEL